MKPRLIFFSILFSFIFLSQNQIRGQILSDSTSSLIPEHPKIISVQRDSLEKKSPMGALFRSVLFPGWGQFYNKKYLKSGVVFCGETFLIVAAIVDHRRADKHKKDFDNLPWEHPSKAWEWEQYDFYKDRRNRLLWGIAATIFVSMFDAYVDAHLYDFHKEQVGDFEISLVPQIESKGQLKILFSLEF